MMYYLFVTLFAALCLWGVAAIAVLLVEGLKELYWIAYDAYLRARELAYARGRERRSKCRHYDQS